MARRDGARAHAGELERHDLFAQQRHQPADRPDEARAALAGPVHGLREVDAEGSVRAALRPGCRGCAALHLLAESVVLALGRRSPRARSSGVTPCLRAKPATACAGADFGGPRTRSSVSGWRSGRPSARSTRRRGVASRLTDSCGISELLEQQAQVFERGRDHPIGNFLGADFEQERQAHCATSARPFRCWSTHACATPTASLRTRWITPTRSVTLMAPRAVQRIKQVRALQHLVVGGQQRESASCRALSDRRAAAGAPPRPRAGRTASTAWRRRPFRSCRPNTAVRPCSARRRR